MTEPPDRSRSWIEFHRNRFEEIKQLTPIAIYGSFFQDRKDDLVRLRDYLRNPPLNYNVKISEDLDTGLRSTEGSQAIRDRELSERLITESDAHIFIMPRRWEGESDTLVQSVSMELEHLYTLIECGEKCDQQVAVFFEEGLMDLEGWGFGGVCRGLLGRQEGKWTIGEFKEIDDVFPEARSFCLEAVWRRAGGSDR